MTVRVGEIELIGLQTLHTEDARAIIQQRGPGQQGSISQDLGREPVTIVMEGLLLGDTHAALEELRAAQQEGKPLAFAADVIAGATFTDVLILAFNVRQLAGYRDRYWFHLRVREYTEPPLSGTATQAEVDAAIDADANVWAAGASDAGSVLQDPATLPSKVADNPELIEHLSADELSSVVDAGKASIGGTELGDVLAKVGQTDPSKLGGVLNGLKQKGALATFIEKFAAEGVRLKQRLSGIDLGAVVGLVTDITSGTGIVADLQAVVARAEALTDELTSLDPLGPFAALVEEDQKQS